jgi:hypothetical protein
VGGLRHLVPEKCPMIIDCGLLPCAERGRFPTRWEGAEITHYFKSLFPYIIIIPVFLPNINWVLPEVLPEVRIALIRQTGSDIY